MANDNKLTSKQEHFAMLIAKGSTQSDAYRIAYDVQPTTGYASINVNASKLMANDNIALRVNELRSKIQNKIAKEFSKSKIEILEELEALKQIALNSEDIKEARANIVEQAKLLGYYVEKIDNTNKNYAMPLIKIDDKVLDYEIGEDVR